MGKAPGRDHGRRMTRRERRVGARRIIKRRAELARHGVVWLDDPMIDRYISKRERARRSEMIRAWYERFTAMRRDADGVGVPRG